MSALPSQPIMDLFWGSPHLVWLLMVTEWGQRVSPGKKQGGTLGPFIYLSRSKHCLCLTQCAHLMHALFLFTWAKSDNGGQDKYEEPGCWTFSGDAQHLSDNVHVSQTQRVTLVQWAQEKNLLGVGRPKFLAVYSVKDECTSRGISQERQGLHHLALIWMALYL